MVLHEILRLRLRSGLPLAFLKSEVRELLLVVAVRGLPMKLGLPAWVLPARELAGWILAG